MQVVEQHVIKRTDSRYAVIDAAAFASKNLYNAALYEMRQAFIFQGLRLTYETMDKRMKAHPAYKALPAKVSQQVLRLLDKNWKAWEEGLAAWQQDQSQFLGRPGLPGYLDKQQGRHILVYTIQALSKPALRRGVNDHWTSRMQRMLNKRTRHIDHYLHTASKRIIDLLVQEGIGTLVIGKNPNWKQECEMRKADKQHFVQIPHARFVDMLCYKAKLVGIQVVLQEESYTSKASFLDHDPMPTYGKEEGEPRFSGKRVKRGLYRAKSGRQFNADVNGSYNILRKASPNAFGQGSRGCVVHPVRLPA